MYTPTHVQVTVHRARGLLDKGKGGNDAFATVGLGKEKFSTSIKEKTVDPQWHEECDFEIPNMDAEIKINVYHRNLMGLDEFLGQLLMPLRDFDMYDTPKSTWYPLRSKPSKKGPQKNRGEVAVKVAFVVRSKKYYSTSDLALGKEKKRGIRKSITNLAEKASKVGDKLKLPGRKGSLKSGGGSLQHLDRDYSSLSPATPFQRRKLQESSPGSVHSAPLRVPSNPVQRSHSDATRSDSARSRPSLEEKSSEDDEDLGSNNPFGSNVSSSPKSDFLSKSPVRDDVFTQSPPKRRAPQPPIKVDSTNPFENDNSFGTPYRRTKSPAGGSPDSEVTRQPADQSNGQGHYDVVDSKSPTEPANPKPDRQTSQVSISSVKSEEGELNQSNGNGEQVVYKSRKEKDKLKKYKESSKRKTSKADDFQMIQNGIAKGIEERNQQLARTPSEENLTPETMFKYQDFSRKQLILLIEQQKEQLSVAKQTVSDMEEYIDRLLLQVMEKEPTILQHA